MAILRRPHTMSQVKFFQGSAAEMSYFNFKEAYTEIYLEISYVVGFWWFKCLWKAKK